MSDLGTRASSRIEQVDTLRAVAASLVVVHHSLQSYHGSLEDVRSGIPAVIDLGRIGVAIFFMISGFVIVKTIPSSDADGARLFWMRRFFRLYPAFWVAVIVAAATSALVGASRCCAFAVTPTTASFVANMTMVPLRFHQPALLGIFWTLELELFFYGLVTLIALSGKLHYRFLIGAAALLFCGAMAEVGRRVLTHGPLEVGKDQIFLAALHLSLMFCGAAIRSHWETISRPIGSALRLPRSTVMFLTTFVLFFVAVTFVKVRNGADIHSFRVGLTYILAVGLFLGALKSWRGSEWGRYLGARSYGIYLLHLPILSLFSLIRLGYPTISMPYPVYLAIVALVTIGASDLLFRAIERPANRLGHRWFSNRNRKAGQSVPVYAAAMTPAPVLNAAPSK